ncbi:hypothetical protein L873DRAFT_382556 [Choiromyces venosus 120613-1]|uniref:Uncharacterized protein n=1 Tax=Choiromyces venosus 120613-1 TaxID=1336337 RepID=A0A3N4J2X5_9PEZI|nr:hypothetical protein L873DRAFT_382556 [Choiromyces venosus 120613-1]
MTMALKSFSMKPNRSTFNFYFYNNTYDYNHYEIPVGLLLKRFIYEIEYLTACTVLTLTGVMMSLIELIEKKKEEEYRLADCSFEMILMEGMQELIVSVMELEGEFTEMTIEEMEESIKGSVEVLASSKGKPELWSSIKLVGMCDISDSKDNRLQRWHCGLDRGLKSIGMMIIVLEGN